MVIIVAHGTGPDRIKQPNPVSGTGQDSTFVRSGILSKFGHFIRSGPVRYRRIPDKTTSGTAAFHYGLLVLTVKCGYFGTFLRKISKKYVSMICYRVERHVSIKFLSTNYEI